MEFTFPDSGKTIKVEGLSYFTLSMIRGKYDNYPGKPEVPMVTIDKVTEPNPKDEAYVKAMTEWGLKMSNARWAAQKLYYASCIRDIDQAAVDEAIEKVKLWVDLPAAIKAGYEELGVPFEDKLLSAYIYLYHVCMTNSAEQSLFEDMVWSGSGPTQEAVQAAHFRLRTQV